MCISTRADSTGPKGEKICSKVAELVVPGMLPIHKALVGIELCSDCCSGEVSADPGAEAGVVTAATGAWVNTSPEGAGAAAFVERPFGAESILPKPIRTGAVPDKAET